MPLEFLKQDILSPAVRALEIPNRLYGLAPNVIHKPFGVYLPARAGGISAMPVDSCPRSLNEPEWAYEPTQRDHLAVVWTVWLLTP